MTCEGVSWWQTKISIVNKALLTLHPFIYKYIPKNIFFSIEMRPSIRYANALNNFYQIEKLSAQVELIFFINLKIFQHIYSIYNRHQFFCLSDFQSNPIILCVYYYYTLITFNYKEEVITFTDWHLKRKGFWDWNPYENKCKWLWHMYNGALI